MDRVEQERDYASDSSHHRNSVQGTKFQFFSRHEGIGQQSLKRSGLFHKLDSVLNAIVCTGQ